MSLNQAIPCEKEYEVEVVDKVVRKFRTRAVSEEKACERIEELIDSLTTLPDGELEERDLEATAIRDGSETMIDFKVAVKASLTCSFHNQRLNVAGAVDNWEERAGAEDFRDRFVRGEIAEPDYFWYDFKIEAEACEYKGVETTRFCSGDKEFQRAMLSSLKEWISKELQRLNGA
ncbi:MAG: hypothetical protein IJY15_13155 [Thermoguttaceae bacterium]|nr:hypothetical protein [Thermoguttaceae bacterium]